MFIFLALATQFKILELKKWSIDDETLPHIKNNSHYKKVEAIRARFPFWGSFIIFDNLFSWIERLNFRLALVSLGSVVTSGLAALSSMICFMLHDFSLRRGRHAPFPNYAVHSLLLSCLSLLPYLYLGDYLQDIADRIDALYQSTQKILNKKTTHFRLSVQNTQKRLNDLKKWALDDKYAPFLKSHPLYKEVATIRKKFPLLGSFIVSENIFASISHLNTRIQGVSVCSLCGVFFGLYVFAAPRLFPNYGLHGFTFSLLNLGLLGYYQECRTAIAEHIDDLHGITQEHIKKTSRQKSLNILDPKLFTQKAAKASA